MDRSDVQETLVTLYLRLNGYFASGFIVHAAYGATTEMDVLAVRFPRHEEPEREAAPSEHLAIPRHRIDFVVGEVKGGTGSINFNARFREDPNSIRSVLLRFGAFDEAEVDRLCAEVPSLLDPANVQRAPKFPSVDVRPADVVATRQASLRFVPFAAEQQRPAAHARPYVFGDDLLSYAWTCFRPEHRRARSGTQYNYDLWGPQFVTMVRYFKEPSRSAPGTIEDLYREYRI